MHKKERKMQHFIYKCCIFLYVLYIGAGLKYFISFLKNIIFRLLIKLI